MKVCKNEGEEEEDDGGSRGRVEICYGSLDWAIFFLGKISKQG